MEFLEHKVMVMYWQYIIGKAICNVIQYIFRKVDYKSDRE